MNDVITHLRTLMGEGDGTRPTDGQLLESFVSRRDPAALETLVRRHGPMVWGVCRRVLANYQDAEDAFQATFLVLVRKAASITSRELVANWIYAVATQTALKARATAAKRWTRERQVTEMPEPVAAEQAPWPDLRPLMDQELSRLPDKYRAVIVLCDLEGKTRKEAAQQLGVPEGTIASRMATGRTMLAKRLARHGLAVSGGMLAGLTENVAPAGVPASVVSSTINAANLLAAGETGGVISVKVIALTEGVINAMMITKVKKMGALFLILGVAVLGGGLFILQTQAAQEQPPAQSQGRAEEPKPGDLPDTATAQEPRFRTTLDVHFAVTSLAFSPNNKTLASGSYGNTVKLWDAAMGKELATLEGHTNAVLTVAFSPDGKTLASGSQDKTIKLWDVKTGKELVTLKGLANSVVFSPDGKTLASASGDPAIQLWDVETGKERAALKGHTGGVHSVAYSPDGNTLASGGSDKTVRLWDVKTGTELAILKGHPEGVASVAFSSDGKTLASGGGTNNSSMAMIKLWDVKTGKELATLKGIWGVASVAFSPDGKTLAAQDNLTIKLWDVATGKEQFALEFNEPGVWAVVYSPDGKTLAAAGKSQKIKLWDVKPGK
jgi:RNA polymerase sigma factor (sigma-70 family)